MSLDAPARLPPQRRKGLSFGWLDAVLLACVLGAAGYFIWRTQTVLYYKWDWSTVWPWILRVDPKTGGWVPNAILLGLATTLRLAIWGILLAAIIGAIMGWARTSKRLLPRLISTSYVMLIRNIPPIVFVFVFVFFITSQILPSLGIADRAARLSPDMRWWLSVLFGPISRIENFLVGLICLSVFTGAYVTEIVRAGIESVPRSQIEAGNSLGLSRFDVLRDVVFPQALRNVIPPMSNQFIQMIKDSSLVSLVSVQELTFVAQDIQISTQRVFEVLLFVGLLYFMICWSLSLIFGRLERDATRVRG
ncbi:MAG: amino acid ABC transporter permease [Methylobacterium sp.]|jgi:polar amino acid transport system permease protein|nr:amino acid ABC transporter permease [Cupriavidus sp.]MCA3512076.1 amino acid ABC transporter permease [Rhodobacter sp.]MCA3657649.1 amino acid ABC transporter permease [Methylobacterium sp.]MCZ8269229.1 amino acid ABC transporter permease [Beijerinckiaceae bacterium]MCA3678065.1 amino acid ABC transporter permease [Methylobacterium sp.]